MPLYNFDSRVKGGNFPRADVDIGIEGPKEIPSEIKLKIEQKIDELLTLYKFDIVDFKKSIERLEEVLNND